jgi:hypothetical protein
MGGGEWGSGIKSNHPGFVTRQAVVQCIVLAHFRQLPTQLSRRRSHLATMDDDYFSLQAILADNHVSGV